MQVGEILILVRDFIDTMGWSGWISAGLVITLVMFVISRVLGTKA